jgi:hypothetical protein
MCNTYWFLRQQWLRERASVLCYTCSIMHYITSGLSSECMLHWITWYYTCFVLRNLSDCGERHIDAAWHTMETEEREAIIICTGRYSVARTKGERRMLIQILRRRGRIILKLSYLSRCYCVASSWQGTVVEFCEHHEEMFWLLCCRKCLDCEKLNES